MKSEVSPTADGASADLQQTVAELQRQLVEARTERDEVEAEKAALAEVLGIINSSPGDLAPVFDAILKQAHRSCGADLGCLSVCEGKQFRAIATHNYPPEYAALVRQPYGAEASLYARLIDGERYIHIPDVAAVPTPGLEDAIRLTAINVAGIRTVLLVPLRKEDAFLGYFSAQRREVRPYSEREITLIESFAAQAVIALENVRLFTELRNSLERLKAAQANLIQAEKMASLGQLSAGIAHEIKNPLNFVNNFAGLASELVDDLRLAVEALIAEPDDDKRAELQDTMNLLTGNLAKIAEHGRRADGIVKSMLSHSRGGTGDWQEVNVNSLVEEALNLAYHGARAQNGEFNVALERDFAPKIKPVNVVPQDVTRVLLNLFGNGFYATRRRQRDDGNSDYQPMLKVSTHELGEAVEIRVRDNGTGILPEVRDKLFQPFFTTKPTGEGTGLGLSITYDIVTQQHGGTITVDSEVGEFSEFTVRLPRRRHAMV